MANVETAVVTGAASGIGRALAVLLAERGYRVALFDVDGPGLDSVTAQVGAAVAACGDVADAVAVQAFADEVGPVDLLCLNAGVVSTSPGPPWEASQAEWERVLGVNVLGVVNGLRSFVPAMIERPDPARILITASLAGAATWPGGGPYAASKHAVLAVAEQAALGLADTGVGVTVICPALVRTAMSQVGADPREVATVALEAVAEGRFAVIADEWARAVEQRARTLVSGRPPELPTPE